MTHAADPTPPTDAEAVRADIEATRAELAQTVDALHRKLDVKAQAAAKVAETRQKFGDTAARAKASAPPPIQHTVGRVTAKAGPVVHQASAKAAPHRKEILVGTFVAIVAVVLLRKRQGSG